LHGIVAAALQAEGTEMEDEPNEVTGRVGGGEDDEPEGALLPAERIRRAVLAWPGVTVAPHRFGGEEFRLGKRELGHLHGQGWADLPFPVRVREELVRAGRAQVHHILPESGWVSYPIRGVGDVAGAIALFRLAYERAVDARGVPAHQTGGADRD
jgi:hypothetical protein